MQTSMLEIREDEKGFTLVELAVVMIIIGLLIGGILKGQELITNARVTSTASQMEAIGAAYNGFRDQYNALPGDMATATGAGGRMANCGAAGIVSCANGDGNGVLGGVPGAAPPAAGAGAGEGTNMFGQLLAGEFITGMDGTNPAARAFGNQLPTAPIGGGFTAGDVRAGAAAAATGFTVGEMRPAPYLVVTGTVAAVGANQGVLTPQQAANIDRRLDDGVPNAGTIVAQTGNAADCRQAAGIYSGNDNQVCVIAYRLQ